MKKVENPLKGLTDYGWHFEQEVFMPHGLARTVKSGGGSGNIPKVLLYEENNTIEHRGRDVQVHFHASGQMRMGEFPGQDGTRGMGHPDDKYNGD